MPIESLWCASKSPFTYRAAHDLEGLLSTIITVCNYTIGPGGQLREFKAGDDEMLMNSWFTQEKTRKLACMKSIHLEAFKTCIQPDLPEYWQDFATYLHQLIEVTWDSKPFLGTPTTATHHAYRKILLQALDYYNINEQALPAPYAVVSMSKQRSRPGPNTVYASRKRQRDDNDTGDNPDVSTIRARSPRPHFLSSFNELAEIGESE